MSDEKIIDAESIADAIDRVLSASDKLRIDGLAQLSAARRALAVTYEREAERLAAMPGNEARGRARTMATRLERERKVVAEIERDHQHATRRQPDAVAGAWILYGEVRGPSGGPIAGAELALEDARGRELACCSSDGEGNFIFQPIEAGKAPQREELKKKPSSEEPQSAAVRLRVRPPKGGWYFDAARFAPRDGGTDYYEVLIGFDQEVRHGGK